MESQLVRLIEKWSESQGQVFTLADLSVIFSDTSKSNLFKRIQMLEIENILVQVKRGLYATVNADLATISNRICSSSYVSFGNVLAQNLIIGSVPAKRIQAVKVGPARTFEFRLGKIEHFSISPKLYFGFENIEGINFARPEKAFLDAWYFFYKGKQFSFDLDTDVDVSSLNRDLIDEYLMKYDKRFVTFFRNRWTA